MTFKESVEWTANHLKTLNIGGVWCIPRSGITFARANEFELRLIDAMPFEALEPNDEAEGYPKTREELIAVQTTDFRQIAERAIAAGYLVTSEVSYIQPISFDLSK